MTKPIAIFRPGTHTAQNGTALSFSEDDLRASAAAYDPALHEAPIVVGHPANDAPAYGWVKSLNYGDGLLSAQPDQVDAAFAELVAAGRYKKISASFYTPDSKANPKPGVYYLRHVGFLGAQPPAVKGLKSASFADGDACVIEFSDFVDMQSASLWRRLREFIISKFGLDDADSVIPDYAVKILETSASDNTDADDQPTNPSYQETAMADTKAADEIKAREQAIASKEASFAEREKSIADKERLQRQKDAADFVEKLVKDGKVLPRDQAGLVAFMSAMNASDVIEFGEGDAKQSPKSAQWLREFLDGLPKAIDYSERARADNDAQKAAARAVRAPDGYSVSPERAEIHARAVAYQESNKVDYITAVRAVENQ